MGFVQPFALAVLAIVLVIVLGRSVLRQLLAFPAPPGPYPVGTTALTLGAKDAAGLPGAHPLRVQAWYPSQASLWKSAYGYSAYPWSARRRLLTTHAGRDAAIEAGGGRLPLLVHAAGWLGRRTDSTVLAEHLASNGFVVVAIDDAGHGLPAGEELAQRMDFSTPEAFEATLRRGAERVRRGAVSVSAVLDAMAARDASDPDGRFTGRLDLNRVGVLGYSMGGAVAVRASQQDARFKAALNLDGYLMGTQAGGHGAPPYFLFYTEAPAPPGANPDPPYVTEFNRDDEAAQRELVSRGGGYILHMPNAVHADLSDDVFFSLRKRLAGDRDFPRRVSSLVGACAVAFFEQVLNHRPPAPVLLQDQHGDGAWLERFPIPGASHAAMAAAAAP